MNKDNQKYLQPRKKKRINKTNGAVRIIAVR